jgi:predicted nucleic acid-binding protein
LTDERVTAFIERIEKKATLIDPVPSRISYERNPDDEPVLNLGLEANARYLVTRDNDLLDLMQENDPVGKLLRQQAPDLTILDPTAFLRAITGERPWPSQRPNG